MKLWIVNSFSLQMLSAGNRRITGATLQVEPVSDPAKLINEWKYKGGTVESAIEHKDLAAIISKRLNMKIEVNRASIRLDLSSALLVCQYLRPQLPEGTTELPIPKHEDEDLCWMEVYLF